MEATSTTPTAEDKSMMVHMDLLSSDPDLEYRIPLAGSRGMKSSSLRRQKPWLNLSCSPTGVTEPLK